MTKRSVRRSARVIARSSGATGTDDPLYESGQSRGAYGRHGSTGRPLITSGLEMETVFDYCGHRDLVDYQAEEVRGHRFDGDRRFLRGTAQTVTPAGRAGSPMYRKIRRAAYISVMTSGRHALRGRRVWLSPLAADSGRPGRV